MEVLHCIHKLDFCEVREVLEAKKHFLSLRPLKVTSIEQGLDDFPFIVKLAVV